MTRGTQRCAAIVGAVALDRMLREPPTRLHPVAWFGTVMGRVESIVWSDRRCAGAVYALTGAAIGASVGFVARRVGGELATMLLTAGAIAGSDLRRTARGVADLLERQDVAGARVALRSLAGRDPSALDESGVSAAVIESLAENTVDAAVATIGWALVGGAAGATVHRAVNTMDAMVGHRSSRYERFGWLAAKLDDAMAWVPARVFAVLVAAVRPRRACDVWRIVRSDAPAHPSPNAGVAEAAVAAALGLQLGGPLRYGDLLQDRPTLGHGPRPVPGDIGGAIRLVDDVERALCGLLLAVAAGSLARARRAGPTGTGR